LFLSCFETTNELRRYTLEVPGAAIGIEESAEEAPREKSNGKS
jgi:hypothetical protein